MSTLSPAARELVLAFADDEHLMGQQYTEWIGVAPFLEEDLAFASIGQDELGHAAMLYEVIVGLDEADLDEFAFFRDADAWRSSWLVERSFPGWEHALVRHWFYDLAEVLRWQLFEDSSVQALADVAVRALSEERFHRRHADAMLNALLDVDDARSRLTRAAEDILPYALGLFDVVAGEADAIAEGVVTGSFADQLPAWRRDVEARFPGLDWSQSVATEQQSRTARHDNFAPMLSRIREVFELDRQAIW